MYNCYISKIAKGEDMEKPKEFQNALEIYNDMTKIQKICLGVFSCAMLVTAFLLTDILIVNYFANVPISDINLNLFFNCLFFVSLIWGSVYLGFLTLSIKVFNDPWAGLDYYIPFFSICVRPIRVFATGFGVSFGIFVSITAMLFIRKFIIPGAPGFLLVLLCLTVLGILLMTLCKMSKNQK